MYKQSFINSVDGLIDANLSLHVGVPHSNLTTTQLAVAPFLANSPVQQRCYLYVCID